MFMSGMNPYSSIAFSLLTMAIGVPSAIKTFNWIGTIWDGRVQLTTAKLFALGFVSLFVTGGITGIFLAQPSLDLHLHDTYFVVAHFHLIMGVAAIFGMFAGTFYWFPKMFGRMMNEGLGKTALLDNLDRRLLHLFPHALHGILRTTAALLRFLDLQVPGRLACRQHFHEHGRHHHGGLAVDLSRQPVLEHGQRPARRS